MNVIKIETAQKNDWPVIQKLNDKIFTINLTFDASIDPDWEFSKIGQEYFKERCNNSKYITLIAYENAIPVGYADGFIEEVDYYLPYVAKTAVLENLGVLPTHQRKGIATLLLENLITSFKAQGATSISAESYYQNTTAISFYKSHGFEPADIILKKKI